MPKAMDEDPQSWLVTSNDRSMAVLSRRRVVRSQNFTSGFFFFFYKISQKNIKLRKQNKQDCAVAIKDPVRILESK